MARAKVLRVRLHAYDSNARVVGKLPVSPPKPGLPGTIVATSADCGFTWEEWTEPPRPLISAWGRAGGGEAVWPELSRERLEADAAPRARMTSADRAVRSV